MKTLMEHLYPNIQDAKAFELSFTNFIYGYDDMTEYDFASSPCEICEKIIQERDYLVPKANCKKPYGILSTYEFGVNEELRNSLIENFDITEEDFRPIRSKRGNVVFYQITPQHVLPPICKENGWLANRPCPKCGSVCHSFHDYENEKGEIFHYISQKALDEMHDLNITYERFRFDMPLCVISRRVYDFLVERYPRTHYVPFFLNTKHT